MKPEVGRTRNENHNKNNPRRFGGEGRSMRMVQLENFTLKQVSDYLIRQIAKERGLTDEAARRFFANAITCNVVVEAINEQIDFLMGV